MKNTTQQLLKVTGLIAKTGKVCLEIKNVYKYLRCVICWKTYILKNFIYTIWPVISSDIVSILSSNFKVFAQIGVAFYII